MNGNYINLKVCPAYAYDYLSILQIKCTKFPTKINRSNYLDSYHNIADEVGDELHFIILDSEYYKSLFLANRKVFELVDFARKDDVYASLVVIANDDRIKAKQELQKRFFPDSPFNEQKF